MNNDIETILYSEDQLNRRMDEIGQELNEKYANSQPLVVPVMTGAMVFTSDMLKRMDFKLVVDPIKVQSYEGVTSSGKIDLIQDIKSDVRGQSVILMEDIIDTGRTLKYLKQLFLKRGAKSVEICAMLDKPSTRQVALKGDYIGFSAPDEFLVGYGLDYDGLYRNLPYIGILKRQVYAS
ncbi:hypoxanthine phosphoribosyltransferase [Lactobacillus colini]|uniref:Hypoxanthine phosphoribosyltransferase n=1 Tax=Lactobacillus colini TaxID=1819254 RepID=A0ABS4MCU0_9LACO|nr:hypoxanthine phosphoribosyltransferase [Lactobacillus colini]MBP2057504.1 hypoxanthine phosphoribosyltransferase [Lactobacillus colini]